MDKICRISIFIVNVLKFVYSFIWRN